MEPNFSRYTIQKGHDIAHSTERLRFFKTMRLSCNNTCFSNDNKNFNFFTCIYVSNCTAILIATHLFYTKFKLKDFLSNCVNC